ncbi:hypothetical protein RclHR1_08700014 [Rhizophagus clarus]|uniref:RNase H type-1 domain-containing protein n=1 Tax=Rhizophagus clarus TaxID=94130 RepID=A0A2Z6S203_9GLOM|nr:hypothetical protein RclHR1_08700014 [Rhizophagus clarus]
MDDTIFIDHNLYDLQDSIDLADEFYQINDILINRKKSEFLAINLDVSKEKLHISIGSERTLIIPSTMEIRYLGCYFTANNSRKLLIKRLRSMIAEFLAPLTTKRISVAYVVYLVNRVLIPRVIYVDQLTTLSEKIWEHLFNPVLRLVKQKCGLARLFPTLALYHDCIIGLNNVWNILCTSQFTNLAKIINSQSIASMTTIIRLKTAQLQMALPTSIFTYRLDTLMMNIEKCNNNLSLHVLLLGRQMRISLTQDPIDSQDWAVSGDSTPIVELFWIHRHFREFKSFWQSINIPIFFIDQLLLSANSLISWQLYRHLADGHHKKALVLCFSADPLSPVVIGKIKKSYYRLMYHLNIDQAVIIVGQIIGYTNESNKLIVSFSQRRDSAVKSFPRERIRILPPASTSNGQYLINSEWAQILNFAADSMTTNDNDANINITPMDTELSETLLSAENGRCHILHSFSDDYDGSRWIHRWIDDVNLRDNLLDAHQDLLADHSTERILDIYTDGSMQLDISKTPSHISCHVSLLTMGAGVFVDRADSQPITISSRLKDWPSSTRAELVAIFLALLIAPMMANINLYTDSQCALDAIDNWKLQRTNL